MSTQCVAPRRSARSSFIGLRVERDDRRRAGEPRALHDVESDTPAADHRHMVAGSHLRGVEHRAEDRW